MKNKYYKNRDGSFYTKLTKEQIREMVDINDPNTFMPLLQEMDYPYYKKEWEKLISRHNSKKVFGVYVAIMNLFSYRPFHFSDSDYLNEIEEKKYNDFN